MPELQLSATKLLDFPDNRIFSFLKTLELFPESSQQLILERIYPSIFVAQDSAQWKLVEKALEKSGFKDWSKVKWSNF